MVKVRGRNSNGKTVKQTVKNGRKISGDDAARPAWVMVPGFSSLRLHPDSDQSRIWCRARPWLGCDSLNELTWVSFNLCACSLEPGPTLVDMVTTGFGPVVTISTRVGPGSRLIVRRPKWGKGSKTESCWYRRVNEQFLQKWLRKSKRNLVAKKARTYEWVIVTYGRFLVDRRAPRVTKATCTFWSQPKARETL